MKKGSMKLAAENNFLLDQQHIKSSEELKIQLLKDKIGISEES